MNEPGMRWALNRAMELLADKFPHLLRDRSYVRKFLFNIVRLRCKIAEYGLSPDDVQLVPIAGGYIDMLIEEFCPS